MGRTLDMPSIGRKAWMLSPGYWDWIFLSVCMPWCLWLKTKLTTVNFSLDRTPPFHQSLSPNPSRFLSRLVLLKSKQKNLTFPLLSYSYDKVFASTYEIVTGMGTHSFNTIMDSNLFFTVSREVKYGSRIVSSFF